VPTVHARTLRRAAEISGDEQTLARRLKVTPSHLALWIGGTVTPPGEVFLKAVDLISEHEVQQLSGKLPSS
jgi:DNA-binding transcriptional regulator YdaS (Cro superfamily)